MKTKVIVVLILGIIVLGLAWLFIQTQKTTMPKPLSSTETFALPFL